MSDRELLRRAEEIQRQTGLDAWHSLMRVLVSELEALDLHPDLEPLREVARRRWVEDRATASELLLAKVACWRFIDATDGQGLATSEGRKARALLCVLEPTGDDEAQSDTAEWFDGMLIALHDGGP